MRFCFAFARRVAGAVAFVLVVALAPAQAATKIQHLISPGGIEAWFVQDATVPLIAMEYAFSGGATQDPKDKPGVANMVASLIDEGSGDLDSRSYHERLDRRAIDLSFSATRDRRRCDRLGEVEGRAQLKPPVVANLGRRALSKSRHCERSEAILP